MVPSSTTEKEQRKNHTQKKRKKRRWHHSRGVGSTQHETVDVNHTRSFELCTILGPFGELAFLFVSPFFHNHTRAADQAMTNPDMQVTDQPRR